MVKSTLVILAAGMGSRYGGHKQTEGIGPNHETILEYSIYDAIQSGFQKVVLVIKKEQYSKFQDLLRAKLEGQIAVYYAFQEVLTQVGHISIEGRTKPWGTAQAILTAKEVVNDPFTVINADDFYGRESFRVMNQFLQTQCQETHYAMVGYILENTLSANGAVSRGLCQVHEGRLVDVREATQITRQGNEIICQGRNHLQKLDAGTYVSMNFWGFHPFIFEKLERGFSQFVKSHAHDLKAEYFISSEVGHLLQKNEVEISVLESRAKWFGMTYQEDRQVAKTQIKTLIEQGLYPESLWKP